MMTIRILIAVLLLVGLAHADPPKPWALGISAERQERANALFAEANALFAQQAHPAALERYRAAIASWDHPQIRFNMAVTLIRLERWLEAADVLEEALRFGSAPFTAELYRRALDYQRQVHTHLGTIDVDCTQRGVEVTLDGKRWFSCPGRERMRVATGEHAVVAEGVGLLTKSRRVKIGGGDTAVIRLVLDKIDAPVIVNAHRRWGPWIVTGAGVLAGAGGAGLWFVGYRRSASAEDEFRNACELGCRGDGPEAAALRTAQDRADREHTIGSAVLIGGGALVLAGVAWAVLDRPRHEKPALQIAPLAGGALASTGWQF